MLLIADSGSTKTTWALLEHGTVKKTIATAGLNPYFHSLASVDSILRNELVPGLIAALVTEIHFYGAGCSTENNNTMLSEAMQECFMKAKICVYHDILGAARALFGKETGIAGILGTGCNSCYYDGREIFSKVPSLGYLFGDEGAGSYLGRTFLEKYLKNKLPEEIRKAFDEKYHYTLEDILNSIYNRPFPNRYLASFSEFIEPLKHIPFMHDHIRSSFGAFFEEQITRYENYREETVSFVGSIAWYYRDILLETAAEFEVKVGTILQSPLEGLIRYHS
jgi:glucosamine kinase